MQFSLRRSIATVTAITIVFALVTMLTITWRRQLGIQEGLKTNGASWVGFPSADAQLLPNVLYEGPIMEDFRNHKRFGTVELKCYDVTPKCIERLSNLEHIDNLYFINCELSDEDLLGLPEVELTNLLFWNVGITDSSIETISQLRGLKKISFKTTKVSPQGIRKLQSALPELEIVLAP